MKMEVWMVTDQQVRRLFKLIQTEKNFGIAAMKAGMDEKTARKYRKQGKLPSELKGIMHGEHVKTLLETSGMV